jgi:Na+/H+ antiporter NhaD/arsenite permease-like protein|tara:strand:+ start:1695 stop:3002 length:1308 start_codon:yes stop_codon:yes gene_type:complete
MELTTIILILFVLGYLAIAFEHNIKIDKAASALFLGGICWAVFAFTGVSISILEYEIQHHIIHISEILFFLFGAMTIVELIDTHQGFSIITDKIKTNNKLKLIWIISAISFFFSAVLDNLATAIVMSSLITKIIKDKRDVWMFGGMVILAANAGGAWSPIGDVTTIMLYAKQYVSESIILDIFIPSLVCAIVPLIYLSFKIKGNITRPINSEENEVKYNHVSKYERNLVFFLGVCGLLFVPVFKIITHLPPYLGMLISLGFLWIVTEIMHRKKTYDLKSKLSVVGVLKKVDTPTIFFFLGILLAVSSLQSTGQLDSLAKYLDSSFNGQSRDGIYLINIIIGLLSSIVDNVPLVAGAMQMYQDLLATTGFYQPDGMFWQFLAYCAGTGGSVLIIGSAAGVAVMGILKIDFIWYLKNISLLAFMGYLSGAMVYILMQ